MNFSIFFLATLSLLPIIESYALQTRACPAQTNPPTIILPTTQGQQYQVLGLVDNVGHLSWITTVTNSVLINALDQATSCDVPLTLILRDTTGSFVATTITLTGNSLINYGTSSCSTGSGFIFAPTLQNTLIGLSAGNASNAIGTNNVAFGALALASNVTGTGNVAIGYSALATATAAQGLVAIGYMALSANTSGSANTAVGFQALMNNTTGSNNTAVGYNVLTANTTGSNNIAIGSSTLNINTIGSNNIACGVNALPVNTSGSNNIALGVNVLAFNTTGSNNIALGYFAVEHNTIGSNNIGIGTSALQESSTGLNNVAIGYQALAGQGGLPSPSNNVVIGYQAAMNAYGNSNIIIGAGAGSNYSSESNNILIGDSGQGGDNGVCRIDNIATTPLVGSFVTVNSLNQLGFDNRPSLIFTATSCRVANALVLRDTTGSFVATTITLTGNSLINYGTSTCGTGSGFIFAPTNQNTLIGLNAGRNGLVTGSANTAYGSNALLALTTGFLNTALGASALATITSGSNNIGIGANSGSNYTGSESNNILIGNTGVAGDNNTIRIGINSITTQSCFIAGISGITPPGSTSFVVINSANQLGVGSVTTLTVSNLTVDTQSGAVLATNGVYTSTIGTDGTRLASFPLTSTPAVTFFEPVEPSRESYSFDDFLSFNTGMSPIFFGDTPWIAGNSNLITTVTSNTTAIGITRLTTGTAQNYLIKQSNGTLNQSLRFGLGPCLNEWRVSLPDTSLINTYTVYIGVGDNPASAPNNGVYFSYTSTSTNWSINTASGGSNSQLLTTVAPIANSFQRLKFQVNGAGSSVNFLINDIAVGSLNTTIPTSNSSSPFANIFYASGNGGSVDLDYWYLHYIFNTRR